MTNETHLPPLTADELTSMITDIINAHNITSINTSNSLLELLTQHLINIPDATIKSIISDFGSKLLYQIAVDDLSSLEDITDNYMMKLRDYINTLSRGGEHNSS